MSERPFPKDKVQVFFIGRPDLEKPHLSMERCHKFHQNNPESKLVVFLWDEKDVEEFTPKKHANCEVVLWKDDGPLLEWLLERLPDIVGTTIVWSQWFACPEGHLTGFNYEKVVQECGTCRGKVEIVQPDFEKVKAFSDAFHRILTLSNFDTTSGEYLHKMVSPTRNVLLNAPYAIGCPHDTPMSVKDAGKGRPGLLCAAGPSLDDAIPDLLRLQDNCLVLCVGRVYKKLRKAGLRVDYAVSVEMFDWDAEIFSGLALEDVGETALAFASVCAPETVRAWPGKKVCMWDCETGKLLGKDDWILGGNSVAHHQLNFAAQILGCEPLILVGHDLAYTKPKSHCDGATPEGWPEAVKAQDTGYHNEERWVPCTGKGEDFHPECHRTPVALGGGGLKVSPAIEVRSSQPYVNFATLFGILVRKHGKKVWNACPNGQKMEGIEYLDLSRWSASVPNIPDLAPDRQDAPVRQAAG